MQKFKEHMQNKGSNFESRNNDNIRIKVPLIRSTKKFTAAGGNILSVDMSKSLAVVLRTNINYYSNI